MKWLKWTKVKNESGERVNRIIIEYALQEVISMDFKIISEKVSEKIIDEVRQSLFKDSKSFDLLMDQVRSEVARKIFNSK